MRRTWVYTSLAVISLEVGGCGPEATTEESAFGLTLPITEASAELNPLCLPNPCFSVPGATLPLGSTDIVVAGTGPFDMVSTAFVGESGEITVVYERYGDELLSSSQLEIVNSIDCGQTFSAPRSLELGPAVTHRATPSAVRLGRRRYLYFASANNFDETPTLSRSRLHDGQFGEPVEVGPITGVNTLLSGPRFTEGPLGWGVAVAFRALPDKSSRFDWSLDGLHYIELPMADRGPTAMPRTAYFGNGAAVFTYQTVRDIDRSTWSWWRISTITRGQLTWTEPALVTTESDNAHDTVPLLRSDGDIDLYYVYSSLEPTDTFKLFRRCLTWNGVLGPEELVSSVGSPNKPNLARLPGGKVLLMYADITRTDLDGFPLEQVLKTAVIGGDAPRP